MKDWFDDDAWWAATHDVMFTERRAAGTPGEIDQVVALLDLRASRS